MAEIDIERVKWEMRQWTAGWAETTLFPRTRYQRHSMGEASADQPLVLDLFGKIHSSFINHSDPLVVGREPPFETLPDSVLAVYSALPKTTPAKVFVANIGSSDDPGQLALRIGFHGSATAGDRAVFLDAAERSISVRPLILQGAGGNVGIGTITPKAPLHVMQPTAGVAAIRIQGALGAPALDFEGGYTLTEGANTFTSGFFTGGTAGGGDIALNIVRSNQTGGMLGAGVDGDTTRRIVINANGDIQWGSGAATRDTILYRSAANVLKTDDSLYVVGQVLVVPGTSVNEASAGGVLYVTATVVGQVGLGPDDLASYSVPANTLAVNNQSLWFEAFGTMAVGAVSAVVTVEFGASTILSLNASPAGDGQWHARGRIFRTGAATQRSTCFGWVDQGGTLVNAFTSTTPAATLSGAVTLRVRGNSSGGANNDTVIHSFVVGWDDANT